MLPTPSYPRNTKTKTKTKTKNGHTYFPLLPTHVSPARSALQRVEFMLAEEKKPRRRRRRRRWG